MPELKVECWTGTGAPIERTKRPGGALSASRACQSATVLPDVGYQAITHSQGVLFVAHELVLEGLVFQCCSNNQEYCEQAPWDERPIGA
jgi:hypothetical protein